MGIEPFLLASSVLGVLAQRLVRKVCPECRKPDLPSPAQTAAMPARLRGRPVYTAAGCAKCKWTGYSGRTGIYELLIVDEETRRLVHDGSGESALRERALARGMTMLRDDGLRWVASGATTIDEVLRVTRATEE
jgi:general secretion pathway protein E